MCSGQSCDGHAEGRAGYIVKAEGMAELNGNEVAAVLTADTTVEFGTDAFTKLNSHLH